LTALERRRRRLRFRPLPRVAYELVFVEDSATEPAASAVTPGSATGQSAGAELDTAQLARVSTDRLEHEIGALAHHHRLLHEGGFTVELRPGGRLLFRRPDGRSVPHSPRLHEGRARTIVSGSSPSRARGAMTTSEASFICPQ
jgi:hypothetical protein